MIDIAAVDVYLSEQGQFCLLDWLLADGRIRYSDYEAWRYGQLAVLVDGNAVDFAELKTLAQTATTICGNLKLQNQPQDFYAWGGGASLLSICLDQNLHQQLAARWLSRRDIPQLDLFMDNSATIAENTLINALANRQFDAAQTAMERLSQLNAQHTKLGAYQNLIIYGQHCSNNPTITEDLFAAEWEGLLIEVTPQALELLRPQSRDYLAFAWRRLALARQQLVGCQLPLAFHVSSAFAQIPDWAAVIDSLESEPELYAAPQLMVRLAEAYGQQRQINACYLLSGLMFDFYPDQAETLLCQGRRPLIDSWDEFLAFDDNWEPQEFLGCLLIRQPQLVSLLDQLPVFKRANIAQAANRAVAQLIRVRAANADEKAAREQLKNASQIMLRYYLIKRN